MKPRYLFINLALLVGLFLVTPNDALYAGSSEKPNFSGQWKLNADMSDDPGEKAREAAWNRQSSGGPGGGFGTPGGGRGGGGFGNGGFGGGSRSGRPPRGRENQTNAQDFNRGMEDLSILHEDSRFELTFGQRNPEIFEIGGKQSEVIKGGEVQYVRVKWKRKGRLEVRRKTERATRWELYSIGAGGEQIYVTVNVQPERGSGFTFRRVYDRVVDLPEPNLFLGPEETAPTEESQNESREENG